MSDPDSQPRGDSFLAAASHSQQTGLVRELVGFLRENKIWWMAPILLVLALVGILLVLGTSAIAPFLYPFL